ncbi:MAG: DUF1385 domain-containing protein [Eubacteriales bacterium]
MKSSNIGGQAVLEGVMMRNGADYAVAVRKQDGDIEVMKDTYSSVIKIKALTKTPFVRGVFNFIDSMVLGMKTLNFSASFYEEEETKGKVLTEKEVARKEKIDNLLTTITMIVSFIIAIGIFMVLPYFIVGIIEAKLPNSFITVLLEGIVRIGIFIGYILLVSQMNDIKRTFMYHGAEHKCINCVEHGLPLTVENVKISSKEHKRCGTSFIFFVLIISIICLFFIQVDTWWMRVLVRILMLPFIAGISYELIKWAGNSENCVIGALSRPGLWMQALTTKEPDEDMIEVAIASVEAIFDWEAYIKELEHDA